MRAYHRPKCLCMKQSKKWKLMSASLFIFLFMTSENKNDTCKGKCFLVCNISHSLSLYSHGREQIEPGHMRMSSNSIRMIKFFNECNAIAVGFLICDFHMGRFSSTLSGEYSRVSTTDLLDRQVSFEKCWHFLITVKFLVHMTSLGWRCNR